MLHRGLALLPFCLFFLFRSPSLPATQLASLLGTRLSYSSSSLLTLTDWWRKNVRRRRKKIQTAAASPTDGPTHRDGPGRYNWSTKSSPQYGRRPTRPACTVLLFSFLFFLLSFFFFSTGRSHRQLREQGVQFVLGHCDSTLSGPLTHRNKREIRMTVAELVASGGGSCSPAGS